MGFFDAIKKVIGDAEQLKAQLNAVQTEVEPKGSHLAAASQPKNITAPELLKTGDIPAKPSVLLKIYGYRDDEDVTFMLSEDFIEFNSHCELSPSYQYEPDNNEDYTESLEDHPKIFFGAPDVVYDAIESYHNTGTAGKDFAKIENGTFLFKARTEYFGDVLWMYAFSEQSAMEGNAICLEYHPDIVGTPLEQKLIAALDEVAMTYTETKTN